MAASCARHIYDVTGMVKIAAVMRVFTQLSNSKTVLSMSSYLHGSTAPKVCMAESENKTDYKLCTVLS